MKQPAEKSRDFGLSGAPSAWASSPLGNTARMAVHAQWHENLQQSRGSCHLHAARQRNAADFAAGTDKDSQRVSLVRLDHDGRWNASKSASLRNNSGKPTTVRLKTGSRSARCCSCDSQHEGKSNDPSRILNTRWYLFLHPWIYCVGPLGCLSSVSTSCNAFLVVKCDSRWKEFGGVFQVRYAG